MIISWVWHVQVGKTISCSSLANAERTRFFPPSQLLTVDTSELEICLITGIKKNLISHVIFTGAILF
jgi:hypothetical protein